MKILAFTMFLLYNSTARALNSLGIGLTGDAGEAILAYP